MPEPTLRVCALYPGLMNIYADRGNLLLLEHRCAWRGIGFAVTAAELGDEIDPSAHDLFYLGGGQDRDQRQQPPGVAADDRRGQGADEQDHAERRGALTDQPTAAGDVLQHPVAVVRSEPPAHEAVGEQHDGRRRRHGVTLGARLASPR